MHHAYREMLSLGMFWITLATVGVIVVIFVVIGPIGSYDSLTPLQRLTNCLLCACFSWSTCYSMHVVTLYLTRFRSSLEATAAVAVAMLVAAVPCTAVAYTVQAMFYPDYAATVTWGTLYSMVAPVALACSGLFQFAVCQRLRLVTADHEPEHEPDQPPGQSAATPAVAAAETDLPPLPETPPTEAAAPASHGAPATESADEPRSTIFDRPPLGPGSDVIYLKSEGRHVHVHTTSGSSRVLVRFTDAIATLGARGMQVHRSYWVAHRQVAELVRRDNHTLLRLKGDHEVPVSRTYLQAVRAAVANR